MAPATPCGTPAARPGRGGHDDARPERVPPGPAAATARPTPVPSPHLARRGGKALARREWILDRRDHPQPPASLKDQAGNDDNTLSSMASDAWANLRDRKVTSSAARASSGMRGTVGATLLLLLVLSAPVGAQDDVDLAKKTQNPVADLISVPFENDVNFGAGPHDDVQYILYIQPVIPFRLTDEWNLISRTVAPRDLPA